MKGIKVVVDAVPRIENTDPIKFLCTISSRWAYVKHKWSHVCRRRVLTHGKITNQRECHNETGKMKNVRWMHVIVLWRALLRLLIRFEQTHTVRPVNRWENEGKEGRIILITLKRVGVCFFCCLARTLCAEKNGNDNRRESLREGISFAYLSSWRADFLWSYYGVLWPLSKGSVPTARITRKQPYKRSPVNAKAELEWMGATSRVMSVNAGGMGPIKSFFVNGTTLCGNGMDFLSISSSCCGSACCGSLLLLQEMAVVFQD